MPFGIGSQLLGNTGAIDAALQRRQTGGSVPPLSQVSTAAPGPSSPTPTGNPGQTGATPGIPGGAPTTPPPGGGLPVAGQATQAQPQGPQNPEAALIIKALGDRLKALSSIEQPQSPAVSQ